MTKPIVIVPIEQILNADVMGNAYHDQSLMDSIHAYVMSDSTTRLNKKLALRKLDEVMGLDKPEDEDAALDEYVQQAQE